jgi:(2Fe-2S) ferredoxin
MSRHQHHVFVCVHRRDGHDPRGDCTDKGGEALVEQLQAEHRKRGWKGTVRINRSGCLGACRMGPTVVVYPEGLWYSPRSEAEVGAVCDAIERGEIVSELEIPREG